MTMSLHCTAKEPNPLCPVVLPELVQNISAFILVYIADKKNSL